MSRLADSQITVKGDRPNGRKVRRGLSACVMFGGFDEPLDAAVETDSHLQNVTVVFRIADWSDKTPPQVGDSVSLEDGSEYKVRRVESFFRREYVLDCRGGRVNVAG